MPVTVPQVIDLPLDKKSGTVSISCEARGERWDPVSSPQLRTGHASFPFLSHSAVHDGL